MIKNRSGQPLDVQFVGTDGLPIASGTCQVNIRGDGTYSTTSRSATHIGSGLWGYTPSAAETNYSQVTYQFVHSSGLVQSLRYVPEKYFPIEEGTSSASTSNTISGITKAPPGSQLEITDGTYQCYWSNWDGFSGGVMSFDPPITGLTGAVGYRIWGASPAPSSNPPDAELTAASRAAIIADLKADADVKALLNGVKGDYTISYPGIPGVAGTAVQTLYDISGANVQATYDLTLDQYSRITARNSR